jgi:hypothetical protein
MVALAATVARGSEPEATGVGLHIATLGYVDNCDACTLFEIVEGTRRAAYFGSSKPDILLLPSHVSNAEANLESKHLVLTLSRSGEAFVVEALRLSSGRGSVFVVTVNGTIVGTATYRPELNAIAVSGGDRFDALVALFAEQ